jgi:hypothetical protein
VDAITDTSKPSFSNGVRSALTASGDINAPHGSPAYVAANRIAVDLLKKDSVQSAINRVLASHKLTVADRAAALTDILHAKDHTTTHTTEDSEGNITSVQKIIHSNAAERIKTVDILNRMDGTYSRAANESQLHTKVLGTMIEEYSKKMRKALQEGSVLSVEGQGEVIDVSPTDVADTEPASSGEAIGEDAEQYTEPADPEGVW